MYTLAEMGVSHPTLVGRVVILNQKIIRLSNVWNSSNKVLLDASEFDREDPSFKILRLAQLPKHEAAFGLIDDKATFSN